MVSELVQGIVPPRQAEGEDIAAAIAFPGSAKPSTIPISSIAAVENPEWWSAPAPATLVPKLAKVKPFGDLPKMLALSMGAEEVRVRTVKISVRMDHFIVLKILKENNWIWDLVGMRETTYARRSRALKLIYILFRISPGCCKHTWGKIWLQMTPSAQSSSTNSIEFIETSLVYISLLRCVSLSIARVQH